MERFMEIDAINKRYEALLHVYDHHKIVANAAIIAEHHKFDVDTFMKYLTVKSRDRVTASDDVDIVYGIKKYAHEPMMKYVEHDIDVMNKCLQDLLDITGEESAMDCESGRRRVGEGSAKLNSSAASNLINLNLSRIS